MLTAQIMTTSDLASEFAAPPSPQQSVPHAAALALPIVTFRGQTAVLVAVRPAGATQPFVGTDADLADVLCNAAAWAMDHVEESFSPSHRLTPGPTRTDQGHSGSAGLGMVATLLSAVDFEFEAKTDRLVWGSSLGFFSNLPAAEFGATLTGWLRQVRPEDQSAVAEAFAYAAKGHEAISQPFRIALPSVGERRMLLRAVQTLDRARVVGVIQDLTERDVEIERRYTDAMLKTVRTLRHDINNPLAIVLGYIQILREDLSRGEERTQQALRSIHQSARRVSYAVRRLSETEDLVKSWSLSASSSAPGPVMDVGEGFRRIVENLPEGVLILDAQHVVQYANAQVEVIVGTGQTEFVGKDLCDVFPSGLNRDTLLERFERHLGGVSEVYDLCIPRAHGSDPAWAEVSGGPYRNEAGEIVGVICTLADITMRRRSEHRLREVALQDPLTALPNRTLLMERLQNAVARSRRHDLHQFAVLFIDLDHLKDVNDSLGHPAGDALLLAVARRLQVCLRPEDTVARYGGDEFVVLLEGIQGVTDATRIALRIRDELASPIDVGGYDVNTSASIGIALSSASATPEQLLHDADAAMYRAKSLGRGRYEIFDREMHAQALARLETEVELRYALESDQFRLLYQPIVSLASKKIVAVEALLVWQHPERGELHPAEFISLAEETRLILPIGRWVLRRACQQIRDWRERFPETTLQWVAVNLSGKQLVQPGFVNQVQEMVEEARIEPESLAIEITERMLSEHEEVAERTLTRLSDLGFKINIDQFGSGYSSLRTLHRLPVSALRIDPSFVSNIAKPAGEGGEQHAPADLIATLVALAAGIGGDPIADGIESIDQLSELTRLGCVYGQGRLFSPAVDAPAFDQLLRRGSLMAGPEGV